jgi:hypothetical protein
VRFEVAEALRQGKRVIPILVNDTPVPKAARAARRSATAAGLQALHLADARFNRDVTDLIQAWAVPSPGRRLRAGWWRGPRGALPRSAVGS